MKRQIAIYGKGGIGKSTISANLSCMWGKNQRKILQIGCDPKHDSTKLLLEGQYIEPVLEYIKRLSPVDYRLDDLVNEGVYGIHCVEAGGPEPGVGCAGRGIISAFNVLDDLGLDWDSYDLILYDVLGDVVCGGFAVPMRREYADSIYIVTSGEYMSIYAANNILRGIKNYSGSEPRCGGLIYNSRGLKEEDRRIKIFSKSVDLPVLAKIPRDDLFAQAERKGRTLVEEAPDSDTAKIFEKLSNKIYTQKNFYPAKPLTDLELETKVLGSQVTQQKVKPSKKANLKTEGSKRPISKSLLHREPLHGCAYNGAMNLAVQIEDGVLLSHGPVSCANLSYQTITSIGRRSMLEKSIVLPQQLYPKIHSSEMGDLSMIFGGEEDFTKALEETLKREPALIIVLTTCPAGIIGDDIEKIIKSYPTDIPIVYIPTDGNLSGDYMQGMMLTYTEIAKGLIEPGQEKDPKLVNFYGEKAISKSTEANYNMLEDWLSAFGAKVHCRFITETNSEKIRTLDRAGLHINAYNDYMGKFLRQFFKEEYNIDFLPQAFPIGYDETVQFIRTLADFYGEADIGEEIIARETASYEERIQEAKKILQGKKLMIITYNQQIDWILRTAIDLNMDIVKVGLLNFSQDDPHDSIYRDYVGEWEKNYPRGEKRQRDIERLKPDLVISNYSFEHQDDLISDTFQLSPTGGFESGIELATRWSGLFRGKIKEGWRQDEKYFYKYKAR